MRSFVRISGAFLCALVVSGPLAAQWSLDPTVNTPVCVSPGNTSSVVSVTDGAGGAFIAWIDDRGGANLDVYAQRIDASGNAAWAANGVAVCGATGDQFNAKLIADGTGGAIIVWTDHRNAVNYDVYAQMINGAGVVQWQSNGVPIAAVTGNQTNQVIVSDDNGGAIIAWMDTRSGTNADIYAQRINSAGSVQWTANGVPLCTETHNQYYPYGISDGAGGATIAWEDYRSGTNWDLYAQRINPAGAGIWTANGIPFCTASNTQTSIRMARDQDGDAVMAWMDYRPGSHYDIYVQRMDTSGAMKWTTDGIAICAAAGDQYSPQVIINQPGQAIIAWVDDRSGPDDDVYAQRIDASGMVPWTPDGIVVCDAPSYQLNISAIPDGAGGAILTWEDMRTGVAYDVYGQKINASGVPKWTAGGIPISSAAGDQQSPVIVEDGSGGGIVAWIDSRALTSLGVYANRIDQFGYYGVNTPRLVAVRDVAADQGGKVSVLWNRADLDVSPKKYITYYSIWRGIESGAIPAGASFVRPGEIALNHSGKAVTVRTSATGETYWEWLANRPSLYLPSYSYTALTLSDSGGSGEASEKYFVAAHTADPFIFWTSNVDSGYSVDNLAPGMVPSAGAGTQGGTTVHLEWGRNPGDPDVKYYEVHRSITDGFTPDAGTLIGETADTVFVDGNPVAGRVNYYRIIAVDIHDNRGEPSNEVQAVIGTTVSYALLDKWNMVSVPLTVGDYAKDALFPSAVTPAYAYSDGYVASPVLANGRGYWLKFSGAQSVEMTGLLRTEDHVAVAAGWNMIGSISAPVDVQAIASTPPGLVTSNFYLYDNGYQAAETIEPGKAYWVKVEGGGTLTLSSAIPLPSIAAATGRIRIHDTGELPPPPPDALPAGGLPGEYRLEQNYPNPFNPATQIKYALREEGRVRLAVYNMLGEEVRVLVDDVEGAGWKSARFDGGGLPSGVYTCRLEVNGYSKSVRMLLLR